MKPKNYAMNNFFVGTMDKCVDSICRTVCYLGDVKVFDACSIICAAWTDIKENGVNADNAKKIEGGIMKLARRIDLKADNEIRWDYTAIRETWHDFCSGDFKCYHS